MSFASLWTGPGTGLLSGRILNASAFSPLSFSPVLWAESSYKLFTERTGASATTVCVADDPVGTWGLRTSGADIYATAATDAKRPTWKTAIKNGLPGVLFDNSDDYFVVPSINLGAAHTIMAVIETGGAVSDEIVLAGDAYSNLPMYLSNRLYYFNSGGASVDWGATSLSTNTAQLLETIRNGTTVQFFRNGTQIGTDKTLANNSNVLITGIGGYGATGSNSFNGHMLEVFVCPSALSVGNRVLMEAYLNGRWGIY